MIITPEGVKFKVVYCGCGAAGKTTNVEKLCELCGASGLVVLKEPSGKTIFFDYLLLERDVSGKKVQFSIFTTAGQSLYRDTKKIILSGADGVIFVVDSDASRLQDNEASLKELEDFLRDLGTSLKETPLVFQYNKRDVEGALPIRELEARLNRFKAPHVEAIACEGIGVLETFEAMERLLSQKLEEGVN